MLKFAQTPGIHIMLGHIRVAIGLAAGSPASPVGLARFAILASDYPEVGLARSGAGPQA